MNYLSENELQEIQNSVKMISIDDVDNMTCFEFDSEIDEYNDFLNIAKLFADINISKTFLLIHKETNELLAYMTLSADSLKLTNEEKKNHNLSMVPYVSIPALKIGKLAVNKKMSSEVRRKGYGSFMLEIAQAIANEMNLLGVACRFITVDADIEYFSETPSFYVKNGFVENIMHKKRNPSHTISMRKDIYAEESIVNN